MPILMIAGCGMHSSAAFRPLCPWDLIAPLQGDDQLALMDHLGIDRFHVAGMCIAGSFIMGLIDLFPSVWSPRSSCSPSVGTTTKPNPPPTSTHGAITSAGTTRT